ncbi:MAG TPA: ATP-binding protein [Burkholderiales bacterium]|nr:ATP-binding protein [Burkholderiales bacterium]
MLSFRRRLAIVHVGIIIAVLAITAFAAHWTLTRLVHGQLDAALIALAETEAGMLAAGGEIRIHEAPPGTAPPSFVRLDRLLQITDATGKVLARSSNLGEARLPTPPALLGRVAAGETVYETLAGFGEEPVRLVSIPLTVSGTPLVIQVAGSLDDVHNVVASASMLFLVMGLALLLTVGAAGALLTGRVFKAIDNVVTRARHIGNETFGARLPHPGTQDEIGRLVDTLNAMLDRLQQSFETQRRFTADASHELRSPLSRLRTELEVMLRRPREPQEYVETLRSCMDEVERLTLLVEELLTLARVDAGHERLTEETVLLGVVAEEAVKRVHPVARQRGVQIELDAANEVLARIPHGSAGLVLTNLLDNAVKFSAPGSRVHLRIAVEGRQSLVSVVDHGPGIADEEMPHIFERFYRGSRARADSTRGFGLGLALSQAIVEAHGGRLEAANRVEGGAVFTVRLPMAA